MVSFGKFSFKSFKSTALTALALSALFCGGMAQAANDPACDDNFMNSMKDKAWMEAQREIMIAQSIIAKPDSVFTLGCFNNFYNSYTGSISFYDSDTYAKTTAGSDVDTYLGDAFSTLGGGHFNGNNSRSAGCDTMMNLWNDARCTNVQAADIRGLTDISTFDRGAFPEACSSPGNWTDPLATVNKVGVGAPFDNMDLFLKVTAPVSQVEGGKCSKGLPTGISFAITDGTRPEVVCPNPGCTPKGDEGGSCCKTDSSGKPSDNCSS